MEIINARKRFTKYMGHLLEPGETITCVLAVTSRGRMRSIVIDQFGGLGASAVKGVAGLIVGVAAKAASMVAEGEPDGPPQTLASFFPNRSRLYAVAGGKRLLPNQIFFVITDRRYLGTCNNPGPIKAHHYILVEYPAAAVAGVDVRVGGPVARRTTIRFVDGSNVSFDLPRGWTSVDKIDRAVRSLRDRADA